MRRHRQRGGFNEALVANLIAQGKELIERLNSQTNFYELTPAEKILKKNIKEAYNSGHDELIKKSNDNGIYFEYDTLKTTTYAPIIELGGILYTIKNLLLKVHELPQKNLSVLSNPQYDTATASTGDLDF